MKFSLIKSWNKNLARISAHLLLSSNWGADMKTATAIAVLQTQNINQLTINLLLVIMIYQCFCVNK